MAEQRVLLEQLEGLYSVFEKFLKPYQLACAPQCDRCCTCNVTLTTLEGRYILGKIEPVLKKQVIRQIEERTLQPYFRPRLSTNDIAARCARGEDLPEETVDSGQRPCPILSDGRCPIYPLRPFGCRCMVSRTRCVAGGQAEMDEVILSANTLMLQIIEHIDADGYSGNFIDVLRCLATDNRRTHSQITPAMVTAYGLIGNRRIPVLMIPPRHRRKLEPLLQQVQELLKP